VTKAEVPYAPRKDIEKCSRCNQWYIIGDQFPEKGIEEVFCKCGYSLRPIVGPLIKYMNADDSHVICWQEDV